MLEILVTSGGTRTKLDDVRHLGNDSNGTSGAIIAEEFLKAGASKGMKTDRKSLMTIDNTNKKIIAKFESYKNK
jgi:phosphopantothenoylcysteine synthetase/decarboxylase